jgi:hypothetical protein
MPYRSKADREASAWMSLPEVLDHVTQHDNCDPREAERQIREALADRVLRCRWTDANQLGLTTGAPASPPADSPPTSRSFWLYATIDWDAGTVVDYDGLVSGGGSEWEPIHRGLAVLRHSVAAQWRRAEPPKRTMATAAASGRCREWLEGLMRKSPNHRILPNGTPTTWAQIENKAIDEFPGLTRNRFRILRKDAVEATGATGWNQGGRPKIASREKPEYNPRG